MPEGPRSVRNSILKTDKRIRLGIWGLGRGMNFYRMCEMLNLDVVAGCDFNEHMRREFKQHRPDALVTDDAQIFLNGDFDAVLLATYCPNHADDAIRCLEAGKHVLSEVTSFHTMAEGVRLVEAVERCGKVYQLAENYPYTLHNRWLAQRWREGLFGDLMYAEYEYVHEVRTLLFTYIDGVPIVPGDRLHNWRSWIHYHYYNTHSLGPMMIITGQRPTRVVSLPSSTRLEGYLMKGEEGMGGVGASLINMEGGAVVRNLMGATSNDTHYQRLWGTRGSAEIRHDGLHLRLGASGGMPKLLVDPRPEELDKLALETGHGGADFFVPYHFAREILFGTRPPFDVYTASDCTIQGILAYRSAREGGRPYDIPNFRNKAQRDLWRSDNQAQPRYDVAKGVFPPDADKALTGQFNTIMKDLIPRCMRYRAFVDWAKVFDDVKEKQKVVAIGDELLKSLPAFQGNIRDARRLAEKYPGSDGAKIIREILAIADDGAAASEGCAKAMERQLAEMRGRVGMGA